MMRRIVFIILFIAPLLVLGQNKQLTIEECIMQQRGRLYPTTLKGLGWLPGTDLVAWQVDDETKGNYLTVLDYKTKKQVNITIDDLNIALANQQAKGAPGQQLQKFKSFPADISWQDANNLLIVRDGSKYYLYNYKDRTMVLQTTIPADAQNADRHKATGSIAYTNGNNVYIKPANGNEFAITADDQPGIVNGQSVHRNEFGITKGTFWGNAGTKLAFYHMDESMVPEVTYYSFGEYPGKNTAFRYPMAGQASHHVKVGVYDAIKKTTVFLETGEPLEQYLTNITWSPDDKYIYVACVMREQDLMYLKRFDAATGKLEKIVFEEKNTRWIEPEHGPMFIPGDDDKFIWQSKRDGNNHLYLYNTDGKLIRQLTSGDWLVTELQGIDPKGKQAFFTATKKSALDNTLYSVDLSKAKITELATETGRHYTEFNTSFTHFIDNHSSFEVPRKITIKAAADGKQAYELLNAPNPMAEYQLGKTEVFTIKSTDGTTDLYARMIKPTNFDPNKKYPVVVYVYGGSHFQLINNGFLNNADLWMNYMAQQGFVVFGLDNRGSANRNFDFESATHRQLGTVEMADQLAGVNYLKQQTFVDSSRMAVFGWSFGGFMTTSLMLRAPGTFKVGIAGGPVIDWKLYEIMYTERYMDSPQENPEGYNNNCLLNYVDNLQGKLLMIHGTSDDVVVWQHSLEFVKKAVKAGKQMDYFVYPAHPHNVRGKDRVHLYQKVTDYIMDNINK
jgi:dipeptidyl-peptidase 4